MKMLDGVGGDASLVALLGCQRPHCRVDVSLVYSSGLVGARTWRGYRNVRSSKEVCRGTFKLKSQVRVFAEYMTPTKCGEVSVSAAIAGARIVAPHETHKSCNTNSTLCRCFRIAYNEITDTKINHSHVSLHHLNIPPKSTSHAPSRPPLPPLDPPPSPINPKILVPDSYSSFHARTDYCSGKYTLQPYLI